ncbi:MAG: TetR/AcrR family transcriptional regulator [Planctomycetota bacterium]|jgi:AcrR family transcriptional regulator
MTGTPAVDASAKGKTPKKARQILSAAEKLFAEGRYHEVTLDDVCAEAGTGKGTIYRYFQDKEDLYWQVILSGLDELVASVQQVGEQEEDPGRGLLRLVECIAGFYARRGALFGLMWSEQLRGSRRKRYFWKEWGKRNERILAVAKRFVAEGIEEGRYHGRISPKAAARLLLATVHAGLWHYEEMPGGAQLPVAIVDLFENGLRVRNNQDNA